jgi:hypothetical protein
MIKRVILSILVLSLVLMFNNCLGYDDGDLEFGIFEGIPIIEIIKPENKVTIINTSPYFQWDTSRIGVSGDFPLEVVFIFDSIIEVDGLDFSEDTKKDHALWMWDSRKPQGTPGNVNLADFGFVDVEEIANGEYSIVYIENPGDGEPPSLEGYDGHDFYWVIIQYDSSGKIKRASKQYRFTYRNVTLFDQEIEDINISPIESVD